MPQMPQICRLYPEKSIASIPPTHDPPLKVLHTIETKTMRLEHDIHATSELNIMASSKPRMITLLAVLAALVGQELIADGSDIMVTVTVFALGAESAEDL
jgi:hypothetical protein